MCGSRHHSRRPQVMGPPFLQSKMAVAPHSHHFPDDRFPGEPPKKYSALQFLVSTVRLIFNFYQNHIYEWVRDHRVHHKYTDTNADPHNASRGFFFSHIGWLMVRKHPDVREKGKGVEMADLERDPFVVWQRK